MGGGDVAQLLLGLGESGVDARLARCGAGEQELQGQRRLAGARVALQQVHPVDGEAAAEDVVEPFDSGRGTAKIP